MKLSQKLLMMLAGTVFLSACQQDAERILRGEKPISTVSEATSEMRTGSQTDGAEAGNNPADNKEPAGTDNDVSEAEKEYLKTVTKVKEQNNNKNRQPLNLTLPSMSWESNDNAMTELGVLPDVFRDVPADSKLGLSGKILWDESEEARQLPVEDTIKGAEVELQFYLP